jgi:hypothetical protein
MSRLGLLLLTVLIMAVACGTGQASPIQNPDMAVLPAPDPAQAVHFPRGTSTAGVAHLAPALDRADITTHDCSPLKPCALATPALSDSPRARQQLGARQRLRRPS